MLTSKALASTIMPLSDNDLFPLKKARSKSSTTTTISHTYEDDFRDGLRIPLPPSSTSSQSEQGQSVSREVVDSHPSSHKKHTHRLADEDGGNSAKMPAGKDGEDSHTRDGQYEGTSKLPEALEGEQKGVQSTKEEAASTPFESENVDTPGWFGAAQEQESYASTRGENPDNPGSNQKAGEHVGAAKAHGQNLDDRPLEGTTAEQVERRNEEQPATEMERKVEEAEEKLSRDPSMPELKAEHASAVSGESQQTPLESHARVSLQDVGLLIRRRDYEQQRLKAMQSEVQELVYRCASFQRRICLQSHLYSLMLNHFRTENRVGFSSAYQHSVGARDFLSNTTGASDPVAHGLHRSSPTLNDSWASKLSSNGSKTVVQLLHQIREVSTFLPDCLANLSSFQLGSLSQKAPDQSATPSPQPGGSIFSRSLDWGRHRAESVSGTGSKVEEVRHSSLALLVYGAFDTPCSPRCREGLLRRERLVDSCVRLISSGKKGSNDFVLSVLEALVESSPWPSKVQVEHYITKLIQDGNFVLEALESQQLDFSEAVTMNNARNAVATAEFYDQGLRNLLDLLTKDPTSSMMPDGVLDFVKAVLSGIKDPKQRSKARDFFVLRWYCSAFLSKALMYPETHGLMMQHHISSITRQKILLEVARRLQQSVAEVLSSRFQGLPPTGAIHHRIHRLITLFEPASGPGDESASASAACPKGHDRHHLMLRPQEFLAIARALLPGLSHHDQASLNPKDNSLGRSSTSSGTGSSTLTAATPEQRTGTASSMAPSFSWTSIASMTTNSEAILSRPVETMEHRESSTTLGPDKGRDPAAVAEQPLDRRLTQAINEMEFMLERASVDNQDVLQPLSAGFACFLVSAADGSLTIGDLFGNHSHGLKHELSNAHIGLGWRDRDDRGSVIEALLRSCRESLDSPLDDGLSMRTSSKSSEQIAAYFRANMSVSEYRQDFQSFHYWWRSLQTLQGLSLDVQETLVSDLRTSIRLDLDRIATLSALCNSYLFSLRGRLNLRLEETHFMERQCDALRTKMWYISDVKHSSAYEEGLIVTKALRSMARPPPPRHTGVAAWARHRLKTSLGSERAHVQTLEALSADLSQGGPGKLSDSQAERTSKWLIEQNIENFCKGEERLHRFCLEVRKTANRLVGENMGKSPALWASSLFQTESRMFKAEGSQSSRVESTTSGGQAQDSKNAATMPRSRNPVNSLPSGLEMYVGPYSTSLPAYEGPLRGTMGPPAQPLVPSFPPPSPLEQTFAPLTSSRPIGVEVTAWEAASQVTPLSAPPLPGVVGVEGQVSAKKLFLENLKKATISLLLSDLGSMLWNRGSETDRWISDENLLRQIRGPFMTAAMKQDSPDQSSKTTTSTIDQAKETADVQPCPVTTLPSLPSPFPQLITGSLPTVPDPFPYQQTYETILKTFALTSDPYQKIKLLHDLTLLATHSIRESRHAPHPEASHPTSPPIPTIRKPRTRATRLEEVIANVEERRGSISTSRPSFIPPPSLDVFRTADPHAEPSDADIISVLKPLFSDPKLRSKTLFRDLQYIAALLPTSYLDSTPEGKSFWTIGLVVLGLKAELCTEMVKRAEKIVIEYFEKPGGNGIAANRDTGATTTTAAATTTTASTSQAPQTDEPPPTPNPSPTALNAAARMYTLAALEGDPTAARELALFYFIHPDLVPTVTLPLSQPSAVFFRLGNNGSAVAGNSSSSSGDNGSKAAPAVGVGGGGGAVPSSSLSSSSMTWHDGNGGGWGRDRGNGGGGGGGGGGKEKSQGKGGLDPRSFALAWHWMEVAASGGDGDARRFLRENGELGKGF